MQLVPLAQVFGAHTAVTVSVLQGSFVFYGLHSCHDKKTLHIALTEHVTLQMARPPQLYGEHSFLSTHGRQDVPSCSVEQH